MLLLAQNLEPLPTPEFLGGGGGVELDPVGTLATLVGFPVRVRAQRTGLTGDPSYGYTSQRQTRTAVSVNTLKAETLFWDVELGPLTDAEKIDVESLFLLAAGEAYPIEWEPPDYGSALTVYMAGGRLSKRKSAADSWYIGLVLEERI